MKLFKKSFLITSALMLTAVSFDAQAACKKPANKPGNTPTGAQIRQIINEELDWHTKLTFFKNGIYEYNKRGDDYWEHGYLYPNGKMVGFRKYEDGNRLRLMSAPPPMDNRPNEQDWNGSCKGDNSPYTQKYGPDRGLGKNTPKKPNASGKPKIPKLLACKVKDFYNNSCWQDASGNYWYM